MKRISTLILLTAMPFFAMSQAQIENPGFEGAWEDVSGAEDEPEEWSGIKSSDNPGLWALTPITAFQLGAADAHSGSGALRLQNVSALGVVANGTISNGIFHAELDPDAGNVYTDVGSAGHELAFTDKPDSVAVWIKYTPATDDTCKVEILLHDSTLTGQLPPNMTDGTSHWVGRARWTSGDAYPDWTRISIPFNYYSAADNHFLLCIVSAGDSTEAVAGSVMDIDDFELIYNPVDPSGIEDTENLVHSIIVKEEQIRLTVPEIENTTFQLINLEGKVVQENKIESYISDINIEVPAGIYVYEVKAGNKKYRGKVKL